MQSNVLHGGLDSPEIRLFIWGATSSEGRVLYRELDQVANCAWLMTDADTKQKKQQILRDWLAASGVTHATVLAHCDKMLERQLYVDLASHPESAFMSLDQNMVSFAQEAVASVERDTRRPKYSRMVLAFFSCLSRIAA